MPRYRLFATDLDGTLFGSDLTISERTRSALLALGDRGVALVLATGRMYQATLPFAQELGITTPLITYQGAWIRYPHGGKDVWHKVMEVDLAREALAALAETGLHVNLYLNDTLYLKNLNEAARGYTALARVDFELIPDWEAALAKGGPTKLVAIGPEPEIVKWQAILKERFKDRMFVTQSQPTFLEFAGPMVGKGNALKHLAEELGIRREEIVAVGDGLNDLDMIEFAGLGVAMGSGHPGLKAAADRVTAGLKEDGVAVLIEQLIAEGSL
ncbi:MAG: Cof-like hydrolase [Cyanobacteria bacterium RYN_339]|nr:Cof-like hydrolase [Cyanobacteria bacterium RYN_339]